MRIVSIEPTPSPHTMKIVLNQALPKGKSYHYRRQDAEHAPEVLSRLLKIDGVKGLYHVENFIALDRDGRADWQNILASVRSVLGTDEENGQEEAPRPSHLNEHYGEVRVYFQMFHDIPMQVKLEDESGERRFGLPERFQKAALMAASSGENVVFARKWVEQSPRYGDIEEIGRDVVEELAAAYDEKRLNRLAEKAVRPDDSEQKDDIAEFQEKTKLSPEVFSFRDWRRRYAALERIEPTLEDVPLLARFLDDPKQSIRRLAVVYLGLIEKKEVLPYLYKAMKDPSVTVRRTAGDCLSDIGDTDAIPVMIEALKDPSRIVRWRAAMFLYEVGDQSCLSALREAEDDPEFEVKMQIKMAIERIESGENARGSVWKQMTETIRES